MGTYRFENLFTALIKMILHAFFHVEYPEFQAEVFFFQLRNLLQNN